MAIRKSVNNPHEKTQIDFKAKLEKKLYLARERPDSIFDLSECNLKHVPSNIFSLCRVFRKDSLFLQGNQLTSLEKGGSLEELSYLKVLNISSNKFCKLPNTILFLKCLQVLDVNNNELRELPSEIGELQNLTVLNASQNNLQMLPNSLGNCRSLEKLIITHNKSLTKLPATLGRLKCLAQLEMDNTLQYPPKEVCEGGLNDIIIYLRKELNENEHLEYPSTSTKIDMINNPINSTQLKQREVAHLKDPHKEVADKLQDLSIINKSKEDKKKLLEDIKREQQILDEKLSKIQEQKNQERDILIHLLQKEEESSYEAVSRILKNNKKLQIHIFDVSEKERKDEEEMLMQFLSSNHKSKPIVRQEILASMDQTVRQEIERSQTMTATKRLGVLNSLVSQISTENNMLQEIIKKIETDKKQLVNGILMDEEFQKTAVISLLERSDATSWKLRTQISIIENKLAELTRLELSKRKLEADYQLAEISKSRLRLTKILIDMFNDQRQRRNELIERIRVIETIRKENRNISNFWLEQYNILLNSKSNEMVRYFEALNPNLIYEFFINGVFHYIPLLKDVALDDDKLRQLNQNTLIKIGVTTAEDRRNILQAVQTFQEFKCSNDHKMVPSAPECIEPSAPPYDSYTEEKKLLKYLVPEECVICLDLKPTIIFLPCGHVCCCYKCFKTITKCPICRRDIEEVHDLIQ